MILTYYLNEIRTVLKMDQSDVDYDDRLITRWLNSQRALFIKNELNKGNSLSHSVYQNISGADLILVNGTMTDSYIADTNYLTTTRKLPRIMEVKGEAKIKSVRLPELGGKEINMVSPEQIKYTGLGRFNSAEIFGTYYKDRIFIKNEKVNKDVLNLNEISIDAIMENPLDLVNLTDSNGNPAYNIDYDNYPINDTLWEYMLGAIRNNRFLLMEQLRDKTLNDDNENT
jgi:hypothetical protein